jgi:hypothetical protein
MNENLNEFEFDGEVFTLESMLKANAHDVEFCECAKSSDLGDEFNGCVRIAKGHLKEQGNNEVLTEIRNGILGNLGGLNGSFEEDFAESLYQAELLASAKDKWSLADGRENPSYMGAIMGATEHHVVQSLGKAAVIHSKTRLDRVPEKGEIISISYDDLGNGTVEPVKQDKGVSR